MNKNIYIIGIGHNSGVTIELAELAGYKIKGLIHYNDDLVGQVKWGYTVISDLDSFIKKGVDNVQFALSMGDNNLRKKNFNILKECGAVFPVLKHPTASISRRCFLGEGVQIHANATIQSDVTIAQNSIVSFGVGVSHNTLIDMHCYLACHSLIGAYTNIEEEVFVGMGAITVSGKVNKIGKGSVIGAGSLVTKSIPSNKIVYGSPAK